MPKPTYPVTAEYRDALERRLRELGWSHAELAEKIGTTPAQISAVLQDANVSLLVPLIDAALGQGGASTEEDESGAEPSSGTSRGSGRPAS